jgi:hypothetical protein
VRISPKQGQDLAIKLAQEFMSSHDTKGWEWKLLSASPDRFTSNNKDRKLFTRYSVLVEYSKKGAVLDGPGVILVDIAKRQCRFFESP